MIQLLLSLLLILGAYFLGKAIGQGAFGPEHSLKEVWNWIQGRIS